jgi:asparagine synthase (glutamine-hydrolysing)
MCGIAGIYKFNKEPIDESTLIRFTDSMLHRGPDGSGYELFDNETVGLGQRRLAILDLSEAGKQPMSYADQRYWITYNGEVFNFSDVKEELVKLNYGFKSNSDTEVILAAYIHWGKDCLNKFNGMWAFAIWDNQKKELFLSRDRFGIKPLYYIFIPEKLFAFASETRAFKFLDGFNRCFDEKLLQINVNDSYALEGIGYTPFKDIVQLLPGHYMIINQTATHQQKRWWHIDDHLHKDVPDNLDDQAAKFYELFRDACKIRLISDVPVATALSGGLDSTAVYSTVYDILKHDILDRTNPDNQRAFSAIFPGIPQNEKSYADKAVNFVGGKINYIETDYENLSRQIEKETELSDLIISAPISSISSIYAGMKKNGITVSMDGHGVDEMLFGYRNMVYSLYLDSLSCGSVKQASNYSSTLINLYHNNKRNEVQKKFDAELLQKSTNEKKIVYKLKKLFVKPGENLYFHPIDLPSLSDKPYDFSNELLDKRILYYEFFQNTLPALLRNFDRAGMMNSVEIRMPFMDWRLVTYVFSLPIQSKLGKGFTKLILREAMKGKMNEDLRTRTYKVGVASPVEFWFNGSLKTWVIDNIRDAKLKNEIVANYQKGKLCNKDVNAVWKHLNIELMERK